MIFKKWEPIELPAEVEQKIERAESLIHETRKREREKGFAITLICKLQLDDDCGKIERLIAKIRTEQYQTMMLERLDKAVLCLKTTSENILDWTWEE